MSSEKIAAILKKIEEQREKYSEIIMHQNETILLNRRLIDALRERIKAVKNLNELNKKSN